MSTENYYLLSKEKVREGIQRCIQNITDLIGISEKIAKEDSDNSVALGLFSFAIEEFGKALLLKESLSSEHEECRVSKNLFTGKKSHDIKFKKALDNLPIEVKNAVPGIRIRSNTSMKNQKIPITPTPMIPFLVLNVNVLKQFLIFT